MSAPFLWANASAATIGEVEAAWRNRESRIRTFDIKWKEERLLVRTEAELLGGVVGPSKEQQRLLDGEKREFRHTYHRRLAIDGAKTRYEDHQPSYFFDLGRYVDFHKIHAFDGARAKLHDFLDAPNVFKDKGVIAPETFDAQTFRISASDAPILLHFLLLRTDPRYLTDFKATAERGIVNDVECLILRCLHPGKQPHTETLWIDAANEYAIMRRTEERPSHIMSQLDVSYRRDPTLGLIATAWERSTFFPDGAISSHTKATVESSRINVAIERSVFEIEFPVNTLVKDYTRIQGDGKPLYFLVRPDGKERIVLPDELRRATVQEIIESETGRAGLRLGQAGFWTPAIAVRFAWVW
jgi:hypothetical protein